MQAKSHYVICLCLQCGDWDPKQARMYERHNSHKEASCRDYQLVLHDCESWNRRKPGKGPTIFPISDKIRDNGSPGTPILGEVYTVKAQCTHYLEEQAREKPPPYVPIATSKLIRTRPAARTNTLMSSASTSQAATRAEPTDSLQQYFEKHLPAIEEKLVDLAGTFCAHYQLAEFGRTFVNQNPHSLTPDQIEELREIITKMAEEDD